MRSIKLFLLLMTAIVVSGCGGGGSSDNGSNPDDPESTEISVKYSSFGINGGYSYLTLTTSENTPWVASCPSTWLTLNHYKGKGSDTISVHVAKNTIPGLRRGNITILGKTVQITQLAGNASHYGTFKDASFIVPDTMNEISPGYWKDRSTLELQITSGKGFQDLNAIETGYAKQDAALYKVRRRTLINGVDAFVVETVPDQNHLCYGNIWINYGTDWYIFSTQSQTAQITVPEVLYVLETSIQFP